MSKFTKRKWFKPQNLEADARLSETGGEILDQTPIAVPAHMHNRLTLAEQVARLVRKEEWSMAMEKAGAETFEEADDFDVDDDYDYDPFSLFEEQFDPFLGKNVTPEELHRPERQEYYKKQYVKAFSKSPEIEEASQSWFDRMVKSKHNKDAPPSDKPE